MNMVGHGHRVPVVFCKLNWFVILLPQFLPRLTRRGLSYESDGQCGGALVPLENVVKCICALVVMVNAV